MNANELADKLEGTAKFINNISNQYHAVREVKEAATMLRQQQAEIEELHRKYMDMHNLATQAMSRNHQLEKEAQEKWRLNLIS